MLTKIRNIFLVCIFGCAALVTATAQNAALPVQLCQQAGVKALTSGLPSTNYLQGVIPYCTVTVYLTGTTTVATTTPQTPLTASATGQFLIHAPINTGYDIVLSGGIPPNIYTSPVTITNQFAGYGGTVIASPQYSVFYQPNSGTTAAAQGDLCTDKWGRGFHLS